MGSIPVRVTTFLEKVLDNLTISDIILTVGKTVRREKQNVFFAYFLLGESKVGVD